MIHYPQNKSGCDLARLQLMFPWNQNRNRTASKSTNLTQTDGNRLNFAQLILAYELICAEDAHGIIKTSKHKGLFVAEMVKHNNQAALLTSKWSQFSEAIPSVCDGNNKTVGLFLITVKQEYWGEATLPFGGF